MSRMYFRILSGDTTVRLGIFRSVVPTTLQTFDTIWRLAVRPTILRKKMPLQFLFIGMLCQLWYAARINLAYSGIAWHLRYFTSCASQVRRAVLAWQSAIDLRITGGLRDL